VRGFTMRHRAVPEAARGTLAGLAAAPVVEYLRDLGVTAVELLPVHAFLHDRHLIERGLRNYWGYNTIGFFAPHPEYLGRGGLGDFKAFVQQMHDAAIEVILDVVYNHTAEGNHQGPTLSFRGIDNKSYYYLMAGDERHYNDFTGTGNALELRHRHVLRMVTDSLRYWVEEMGVDGFRFDLASTLGRVEGPYNRTRQLPGRGGPGSRVVRRQAHRRAVRHRPGRLSGRQLPARLGGVERSVPRHDAKILEGRRGTARGLHEVLRRIG
jgi:glycogen operon protein